MLKSSKLHTLSRRLTLSINEKKFFFIAFKNLALCILTLGIYFPWALKKMNQYLFSKIYFMGKRFICLIPKKELIKFNLSIVFCFLLLFFDLWFLALILLPLILFWGLNIYIGGNTYRLKKFHFSVPLYKFYKVFFGYALLTILTCGLLLPWFCKQANGLIFNNISYGKYQGKLNLNLAYLYKIFCGLALLIIAFFCIILLPYYSIKIFFPEYEKLALLLLIYPYIFIAIPLFSLCFLIFQWKYAWDNFTLGNIIFFECNISFSRYLYFLFSLIFCSIISLGLLFPNRLFELINYFISSYKIYLKGNVKTIFSKKAQ